MGKKKKKPNNLKTYSNRMRYQFISMLWACKQKNNKAQTCIYKEKEENKKKKMNT